MSANIKAVKGKKRMSTNEGNAPPAKKGHWSGGLLESMKDPDMVIFSDEQVVMIKDKYPKAHHHYLVLPREKLPSLTSIKSTHMSLLKHIDKCARKYITDNHPGEEFRFGYHSIPSMAQVHLHAISQDFDSPSLKTKKHWNSFNTDYFIDSKDMMTKLESNGRLVPCPSSEGKRLLDTPLQCHRCQHQPQNMPKLKQHILEHLKTKYITNT